METNEIAVEADEEQLYTPAPGERQFTLRAVVTGCLLGGIVAGMNIYLGLRIGWSVGGSLMAAILGFAGFKLFGKLLDVGSLGVLETNIAQTTGSGAGTMSSAAGLLAPIPAMFMLGYDIPIWGLFLWSLSIAYLGVMFAVPLRRQYVVEEKLRFPTGTATANTIMAMFSDQGEAVAKARALLIVAGAAFVFTLGIHFWPALGLDWWPALDMVPLDIWIGGAFATAGAWGFSLYVGPMLFGAGMLMGPRVGISLLAGAIVGWGLLGWLAQSQGWAPADPMVYHDKVADIWGPRGWILWPGVAIMVADALTSLALSWRTFIKAFQRPKVDGKTSFRPQTDPESIPNSWWMTGLALASIGTITVAYILFDIPIYMSALAIAMSAILANVAVRSTGETDINPIGGMGKVTQLAFGGQAMSTNLMAAGITGAGASQAGDMMQDLKTGYLLGASPRKQFRAQLIGIACGVLFAVPIFYLFDSAYEIGDINGPLPAPAAHAWKAMAEVLSRGLDALPPHGLWAALGGLIFGAAIPVIRKLFPKTAPYMPSGLAFGIAFIVQAYFSITMFFGAVALMLWMRVNKQQCERMLFAIASGLIAGEGLGGILNAILKMFGIPAV